MCSLVRPKYSLGKTDYKVSWCHPLWLLCMGSPLLRFTAPHVFWWGFGQLPRTGTASGRILSKLYLYWINSLPGVLISYRCCNKSQWSLAWNKKNVFSYSSRGQKTEMGLGLKSRCFAGLPFFGSSGGEFISLHLFQLQGAACISWFKALFQDAITLPSSVFISPMALTLLLALIRTHVITLDLPEYSRTISASQNS